MGITLLIAALSRSVDKSDKTGNLLNHQRAFAKEHTAR